MTITCDAYSMATINDKDANIRWAEGLERQMAKKLAFFFLKHLPAGV